MAVQQCRLNKGVTAETRMQVAAFDWDESNRTKCQKHGVSPAAIEDIFRGPIAVLPDPLHSKIGGALQGNRQDW